MTVQYHMHGSLYVSTQGQKKMHCKTEVEQPQPDFYVVQFGKAAVIYAGLRTEPLGDDTLIGVTTGLC